MVAGVNFSPSSQPTNIALMHDLDICAAGNKALPCNAAENTLLGGLILSFDHCRTMPVPISLVATKTLWSSRS